MVRVVRSNGRGIWHVAYVVMMEGAEDEAKPVHAWVGTSLGVLKGVSLATREVTNYHKALKEADRTQDMCVMCWEHEAEGDMLYCGLKNGLVQRFDCRERLFQAECDCTGGEGIFVGLGKHEEVMITCTDSGELCFWPPNSEKTSISVGRNVYCMCSSPDTMLQVATGGKENELKIWDGNRPGAPIFQAKNLRNDKLDLRVPVWVSAMGYIAGSGEQPTVAVATRYHQIRLYDTRVQRRPVYSQEYGDHPFTALTTTEDGRYTIVGNSIGDITRCDLRTGRVVGHYKGCLGGVKCLQCYNDGSKIILASCSLDRYLRIYTLEPPRLLHKIYLKLLPSCLSLTDSKDLVKPIVSDQGNNAENVTCSKSSDDDDDDGLWEKMKMVGQKSSSKKDLMSKNESRTRKKASKS